MLAHKLTRWAVPAAVILALLPLSCAPKVVSLPTVIPPSREIAERLKQEDAKISTLRAEGVLRWKRGGQKGRAEHAMVLKRPAMLRLEGFTPLGTSAYSLTIHDGELQLFVPSEARVYRGLANPQSLARFLSLPLEPEQAVSVLCGRVPLCAYPDAAVLGEEGWVVLEMVCPSGWSQRVRLHPEGLSPAAISFLDASGQRVLEVVWSEFREVGELRMPTQIRVDMPPTGDALSVELQELEVNIPVSESAFRLLLPPGTETSPLP